MAELTLMTSAMYWQPYGPSALLSKHRLVTVWFMVWNASAIYLPPTSEMLLPARLRDSSVVLWRKECNMKRAPWSPMPVVHVMCVCMMWVWLYLYTQVYIYMCHRRVAASFTMSTNSNTSMWMMHNDRQSWSLQLLLMSRSVSVSLTCKTSPNRREQSASILFRHKFKLVREVFSTRDSHKRVIPFRERWLYPTSDGLTYR